MAHFPLSSAMKSFDVVSYYLSLPEHVFSEKLTQFFLIYLDKNCVLSTTNEIQAFEQEPIKKTQTDTG